MKLLQKLYLLIHRSLYRNRRKRQKVFRGLYVISVGNISAGGTGKTPAVIFIARELIRRGKKPLAVLRGYGGKIRSADGVLVNSGDPDHPLPDYRVAGDEALLLAGVPGLKTAAGKNRARVIEKFCEGCDTVLLDDAFQNPSVYRDHELVLIDATVPLENMQVFPSGRFREGPDALSRADTVILTRCDLAESSEKDKLKTIIRNVMRSDGDEMIFESTHSFRGLVSFADYQRGEAEPMEKLKNHRYGAFCGIGNPSAFFRMLEKAGFKTEETAVFADHHPYTYSEVTGILESRPDLKWITTEKDIVRIKHLNLGPGQRERIMIAKMEFCILDGREDELIRRILSKA